MKLDIRRFAAIILMVSAFGVTGLAQNQTKPLTPLKVVIVISKYENERKVSSLPYALGVTANDARGVNLKIGSQLPLPNESGGITYMDIGMLIDCLAASTDDGRFKVDVRIEDSSVMDRRSNEVAPVLRTFVISNSVVLKDGQSTQFSAVADKLTGEIVRVDLTMNVEK